ncbi:MAG: hypothetical protein KF745_05020 [Phycisphaeraceae bacterium]|nr:hypothetical protein [Phycisphaeraceae bacterium]
MSRVHTVVVIAAAASLAGCAKERAATPPTAAAPASSSPSEPATWVETPSAVPTPRAEEAKPNSSTATGLRELLPGSGVRVDRSGGGVVEFDGIVPIDAHDPDAPHVYLEVIVCTPDSKEHESLVMTRAKPSHVHAALLLLGLEPGAVCSWEMRDGAVAPVDPSGPGVDITIEFANEAGEAVVIDPRAWIVDARNGAVFPGAGGTGHWLFAGSRMVKREGVEWYDADGVGTLVGLCCFGAETVAWSRTISPDSQVDEPVWIANPAAVPPPGTPVIVRLRPAAR